MGEAYWMVTEQILGLLDFCYSEEHRPTLEIAAIERSLSFEQLVCAAIMGRLAEQYKFVRKAPRPARRAAGRRTSAVGSARP